MMDKVLLLSRHLPIIHAWLTTAWHKSMILRNLYGMKHDWTAGIHSRAHDWRSTTATTVLCLRGTRRHHVRRWLRSISWRRVGYHLARVSSHHAARRGGRHRHPHGLAIQGGMAIHLHAAWNRACRHRVSVHDGSRRVTYHRGRVGYICGTRHIVLLGYWRVPISGSRRASNRCLCRRGRE